LSYVGLPVFKQWNYTKAYWGSQDLALKLLQGVRSRQGGSLSVLEGCVKQFQEHFQQLVITHKSGLPAVRLRAQAAVQLPPELVGNHQSNNSW